MGKECKVKGKEKASFDAVEYNSYTLKFFFTYLLRTRNFYNKLM